MLGSSIARPDAAGWVTDFLNATHHQRPEHLRDPSDLRLALTILTTYWDGHGHRRLGALDALPFHRAFGRLRLRDAEGAPRGTLDRAGLLAGAERLLGDWFADAEADPSRRGWGIAFRTRADREAHDPTVRLRAAPRRAAHAARPRAGRPGLAHVRARPRGVGRGRRRPAHAPRGVARTSRPSSAASPRCGRAASPGRPSRSRS